MICWLSNGEGPLGCELKIWQWGAGGGGVAEEMTGLPKNCPAPQLINNDRPLIHKFMPQTFDDSKHCHAYSIETERELIILSEDKFTLII